MWLRHAPYLSMWLRSGTRPAFRGACARSNLNSDACARLDLNSDACARPDLNSDACARPDLNSDFNY